MTAIDTSSCIFSIVWLEIIGYLGALFTLLAYRMRHMRLLRIMGLCANLNFLCYGLLTGVWPMALLHWGFVAAQRRPSDRDRAHRTQVAARRRQ